MRQARQQRTCCAVMRQARVVSSPTVNGFLPPSIVFTLAQRDPLPGNLFERGRLCGQNAAQLCDMRPLDGLLGQQPRRIAVRIGVGELRCRRAEFGRLLHQT